jgi:hypothetical protein
MAVSNFIIANKALGHQKAYAHTLGILAAVLASIQYLPQIWTTWKLKAVGSLSIPMMCIQTPGSFLWAASLAARYGWEGWSIWGLFMVTGLLQGILLVMGSVFEYRNWKRKASRIQGAEGEASGEGEGPGGSEDDERTPLLVNER